MRVVSRKYKSYLGRLWWADIGSDPFRRLLGVMGAFCGEESGHREWFVEFQRSSSLLSYRGARIQ